MTSHQRAALQRLVLIVAAWAAGESVLRLLGVGSVATLGGAACGAAAYFATGAGLRLPSRRKRGDIIYWRGRPIDRDDWRH
ncbi:MAG: hypothetical protein ACRDGT_05065 [Candidatus Limnocylindria bacterium]